MSEQGKISFGRRFLGSATLPSRATGVGRSITEEGPDQFCLFFEQRIVTA